MRLASQAVQTNWPSCASPLAKLWGDLVKLWGDLLKLWGASEPSQGASRLAVQGLFEKVEFLVILAARSEQKRA